MIKGEISNIEYFPITTYCGNLAIIRLVKIYLN